MTYLLRFRPCLCLFFSKGTVVRMVSDKLQIAKDDTPTPSTIAAR